MILLRYLTLLIALHIPSQLRAEERQIAIPNSDSAPAQTVAGGFTGPTLLTVNCGQLLVRFDGPKLWTMSGIEYKGTELAIVESAYGSVFNLDKIGFIGSAHREIETERIYDVRFLQDEKPVQQHVTKITANHFRCVRHSRVRDLELFSTVELKNNQLWETARVKADKDVRLEKAYHFMHAWTPKATHFLYGNDETVLVDGMLRDTQEDDRIFHYRDDANWVAVYEVDSQHGAVSRLLESPRQGKTAMQIWNVPDVYRKFYLVTFQDDVMPAKFDGTYRMVTEFFSSPAENWKTTASQIAEKMGQPDSQE